MCMKSENEDSYGWIRCDKKNRIDTEYLEYMQILDTEKGEFVKILLGFIMIFTGNMSG